MTGGMMFKGTPGPWCISENAYGKVFIHGGKALTTSVGTEYRELIAGGNSHDTLTLPNARLIAAAPDLLEALQDLLEAYSKPDERLCCDGWCCGCMGATIHQQAEHYAISAIAKALGETK